MKYAEKNATRYPIADLITIFLKRSPVENIESIKREVETGIPLSLVIRTRRSGKRVIYHSISISAYHFAERRP